MSESRPNQVAWCYFVPVQDPAKHGGYVPSMVFEDKPGHAPLVGDGQGSAPYVWGDSLEEAQRRAEQLNRKMGVYPDEPARIVQASHRLQNQKKCKR